MSALTLADICGTWTLESFEIEDLEKKTNPWGKNTTGLLIYADSGWMSVSINKQVENDSESELENIFDSILFYSGTFKLDGSTISHELSSFKGPIDL